MASASEESKSDERMLWLERRIRDTYKHVKVRQPGSGPPRGIRCSDGRPTTCRAPAAPAPSLPRLPESPRPASYHDPTMCPDVLPR